MTEPDAPFERGGTYWIQRGTGFARWDPVRSDWVNTKELPPAEPLDPSAEPDVDPWKETSIAEDAGDFFVRGPGRNLLLALGIFLAAIAAFWALSTVWDPFDVAHRGVFKAWSKALPFLAAIVAVIWFVVNGFQRVRRGETFVPPRVRRDAEVHLRRLPRNLWRLAVMSLTVLAVVMFLMWWLGGYVKPFGVTPIEFGPWENNPVFLTLSLISAGAAVVVWALGHMWRRR